jgi:hypothetical protein
LWHLFWSFALNLECFRCLWSLSLARTWLVCVALFLFCFVLFLSLLQFETVSFAVCVCCVGYLLFVTSRALVSYVISVATPEFFVQHDKFLFCFDFFPLFSTVAQVWTDTCGAFQP